MLLRKAFIALAIFTFYSIIVETIAVNVLKYKYNSDAGKFFQWKISDRLLTKPVFLGKIDEVAYQTNQ